MKLPRRFIFFFAFLVAAYSITIAQNSAQEATAKPIMGFFKERVKEHRALENVFDSYLQRDSLREWMRILTARPHHTGSPYDSMNARFIASKFSSWGFDTKIEEFHVLFPTPKTRILEMTAPELYSASLEEPPLKEDATSSQTDEQLPIYNCYSIDGDVSGELVFVNYGVPRDYEELEKVGIDVKGKIVIAKYGGSWRGIKPKVAAEHGAVGCIIYSDPREDGYYNGDDYPTGAYRNSSGAQRGSVADAPLHAGDPLTPFIPATKEAQRLTKEEAQSLTKIPVLPISYGDALPLLRNLGGQVVPESWRGALPITYHFGPGPAKVRLNVEFNWDIVPIYNVIATIKGTERPDEWIIRGNHHDAWVNGADDPISGMVATMAEGQALGKLLKKGWKPLRTIIYCAWDAEEQGLLGSTEWVEMHLAELKSKAVVYINSDGNGRGFLFAGGSHSLEKFFNQVSRDIIDPQKRIPVSDRARAYKIVNSGPDDQKEARERQDLRLYALGSGSDYTPFLQHAGIASLNVSYGGENGGGSYHSVYDSYDHYLRFGDPTFDYGVALASTNGRTVLRLAGCDLLPFDFYASADAISKYLNEVVKLPDEMRKQTEEANRLIREKSLEWSADPKEIFVVPSQKAPVPYLNFTPLQNTVAGLQRNATELAYFMNDSLERKKISKQAAMVYDSMVTRMEQLLTLNEGLPGRPWYRHQIYAPGRYTGYGVKTLPSIREAIELRKWQEAEEQTVIVANVIDGYSRELKNILRFLQSLPAK